MFYSQKSQTTVENLQIKMKNLLRAWKCSKDTNNTTGTAPCVAPFANIMEEIFGDSPKIAPKKRSSQKTKTKINTMQKKQTFWKSTPRKSYNSSRQRKKIRRGMKRK